MFFNRLIQIGKNGFADKGTYKMYVSLLLNCAQIFIEARVQVFLFDMREDIPLFNIDQIKDMNACSSEFILDIENQLWGLISISVSNRHRF